jgi:hypothetical protein
MPTDYSALNATRLITGDNVEPDLVAFQENLAHTSEVLKKITSEKN